MKPTHKSKSLQNLPLDTLQLILVRYTLRAFPAISPDTTADGFDDQFFLRHARSLLTTCCALVRPTQDLFETMTYAAFSVGDFKADKMQTAASISCSAAAEALFSHDSAKAKQVAYNAIETLPFSDFSDQAQSDLAAIQVDPRPVALFRHPLWTMPVQHFDPRQAIVFPSEYSELTWPSFWRDWYQGFLDGTPLDWELQRRVALIDDTIWEAGPEAVAKEIERIRAKFELEQEVAALKEQLSTQQQVLVRNPQLGDNGGPPMDGPNAKAFKNDLVLIWSDIEELETELAKPEPSPGILKRIAQTLSETALRIAAYCVETVDLVVKDAAKTIGKGAGGLIVAEYVKPGSIEAVAKAIGKYLTTLAN